MSENQNPTSSVLLTKLKATSGQSIGLIQLNAEKALNSLSLGMIDAISHQLTDWEKDDNIAVILIRGAGEKAFCAGGDIVQLYHSMKDASENGTHPQYAEDFFTREYQLDYRIHCYPKPIICWGNGIIMGGGLGVMAGASHRIVTETARIAMPEITIGLFPDVGGSYFLNRMPSRSGLFVALTGSSLNAADAIYANLADAYLPASEYANLLQQLCDQHWSDTAIKNHQITTTIIKSMKKSNPPNLLPAPQLEPLQPYIDELLNQHSLTEHIHAILNQAEEKLAKNRWLRRGVTSLRNGCPTTAHLIYQQLIRGKEMELAEVFEMERKMAIQCSRKGEFQEGVRALLIDKDGKPNWQYPGFDRVPDSWVEDFFHLTT